MAKLENITIGSTVKGIVGNEPVSVAAVQWYGSNVLELLIKMRVVRWNSAALSWR